MSPAGSLLTSLSPERIVPSAAGAEALGFADIWVAEDYFCYGGFTAAADALAATSTARVRLGVVSAVARHPAVTAMETASLARTHPGRFSLGIGHDVPAWTDLMGLTSSVLIAAMRECITSIRALLAGETVDRDGKQFTFRSVHLAHPPETTVPILTGVVGPRSLRLSGEIADGTILSVLAGTTYLRDALGRIRRGADRVGRTDHEVPVFALCSVDEDGERARDRLRPTLAMYIAAMGPHNGLTGSLGWNGHIGTLLDDGGVEALAAKMPDEWITELGLAGTPSEIVQQIEKLLDAGASSVIVTLDPTTADSELDLISRQVMPRIGGVA